MQTLGQIWELSSLTGSPSLSPPEFIIYCKYLALFQNKIPLNFENLRDYHNKIPFPVFQGVNVAVPQTEPERKEEPKVEEPVQESKEEDEFEDFQTVEAPVV